MKPPTLAQYYEARRRSNIDAFINSTLDLLFELLTNDKKRRAEETERSNNAPPPECALCGLRLDCCKCPERWGTPGGSLRDLDGRTALPADQCRAKPGL
jgi:hypothetical protein